MFNITDYCPHLIPMETSLLTSSLSLLPLGMPPTDGMKKRLWNKALVASHSSYNTEIFTSMLYLPLCYQNCTQVSIAAQNL